VSVVPLNFGSLHYSRHKPGSTKEAPHYSVRRINMARIWLQWVLVIAYTEETTVSCLLTRYAAERHEPCDVYFYWLRLRLFVSTSENAILWNVTLCSSLNRPFYILNGILTSITTIATNIITSTTTVLRSELHGVSWKAYSLYLSMALRPFVGPCPLFLFPDLLHSR
jgi:hypothetical protein